MPLWTITVGCEHRQDAGLVTTGLKIIGQLLKAEAERDLQLQHGQEDHMIY
jgi:hypothetical protein